MVRRVKRRISFPVLLSLFLSLLFIVSIYFVVRRTTNIANFFRSSQAATPIVITPGSYNELTSLLENPTLGAYYNVNISEAIYQEAYSFAMDEMVTRLGLGSKIKSPYTSSLNADHTIYGSFYYFDQGQWKKAEFGYTFNLTSEKIIQVIITSAKLGGQDIPTEYWHIYQNYLFQMARDAWGIYYPTVVPESISVDDNYFHFNFYTSKVIDGGFVLTGNRNVQNTYGTSWTRSSDIRSWTKLDDGGDRFLNMISGADDTSWLRYEQQKNLTSGSYTISTKGKVLINKGRGNKVLLACAQTTCGSLHINDTVPNSTITFTENSWKTKTATFTVPATANYWVRVFSEDGSYANWDNVSLKKGGTEYVTNGTFTNYGTNNVSVKYGSSWSSGDGNWGDRYSWIAEDPDLPYVKNHLRVYSFADNPSSWLRYEQTVNLSAGSYSIGAASKVLQNYGRGAKLVLACAQTKCGNLNINDIVTGSTITFTSNSWTYKNASFSVPASANYWVRIFTEDGTQAYWDNIYLLKL